MKGWLKRLDGRLPAGAAVAVMKWIALGGAAGILTGTASAFFLTALDYVTEQRLHSPWLLFMLPLGGVLVSWLYFRYGLNSAKGNNLLLEQIRDTADAAAPGPEAGYERIPLRMAPLVLVGTLVTHLFGGSAGREGTAVQMGGSLAEALGRLVRLSPLDRKVLLMCGISGGFGSVFGTPLAGTVFALEVAAFGTLSHAALLPGFISAWVGDLVTTRLWGVQHVHYSPGIIPAVETVAVLKVVAAAVLFGLASRTFSKLTHGMKRLYARWLANPLLRSAVGGLVVIALVLAAGTRDYLGLGLPLIAGSFQDEVSPFAFLWKLVFTAATLGAGFQGGEVTPLFAVGATLGHSLAGILHLPVPFLAALGFIAVFSGAANTPLAAVLMGIELFGSEGAVYIFLACTVSYLFAGHTGIYASQRIGTAKSRLSGVPPGTTIGEWSELKRQRRRRGR